MQTQTVKSTAVTMYGMTGTAITTTKGKTVGVEVCLGTLSAKAIREAGRDLGLKGDKLTEYVNKALTDEKANRAAKGAVAVSALQSAGYVFDIAKARTNSASITFVKPPEPKSAVAKAKAALSGMSAEEKAEIMAILLGDTTEAK